MKALTMIEIQVCLCVCVCVFVRKLYTDSVQSHQYKIIHKTHLIWRYKSSVVLEEASNLRKPSDRSACFYLIFMSLTEKVILSDLDFLLFLTFFLFFLLFESLLLIPATIPCLDGLFEVLHELGGVFSQL